MKIDTNTPVAELCERLREWAGYNGREASELIAEAADRLELLAGENEDLRNQNHNNRVAAEARWDRIQRLIEVGDAMAYYADQIDIERWRKAKEAKP